MKKISLSALILIAACGGSSPRNDEDSDSNRRVDMGQRDTRDMYNCPPDSKRNTEDMYNAEKCDSGSDSSVSKDGSLDDAVMDMGREDMETPDMGLPDEGVTYPIARLNCSERNEEGLCVYRFRRRRLFCFDASPSEAAPGRSLVNYRVYLGVPGFEDASYSRESPEVCVDYNVTSEEYDLPEGFPAELEVTDNEGDSARTEMRNVVIN